MTTDHVDTPPRRYTPPVLTRREPRNPAGLPSLMQPFIGRPAAAEPQPVPIGTPDAAYVAPLVSETQLTSPAAPAPQHELPQAGPAEEMGFPVSEAPAGAQEFEPAEPQPEEQQQEEPQQEEAVTHEQEPAWAELDEQDFDSSGGEEEAAFDVAVIATGYEPRAESEGQRTGEEQPDSGVEAAGRIEEEPVAAAEWEPESLEEVWDPTDLAEPTAAADDAAEWPDAPPEEAPDEETGVLDRAEAWRALEASYVAMPDPDELELWNLADRVAERLEDLARDVRRHGLSALGAGAPDDEQVRLDELSKLIAAVVAGFYGHSQEE